MFHASSKVSTHSEIIACLPAFRVVIINATLFFRNIFCTLFQHLLFAELLKPLLSNKTPRRKQAGY